MCIELPAVLRILGNCVKSYPQCVVVEKSGERQQFGLPPGGCRRPRTPSPAARHAEPDQGHGREQPDARREPDPVELRDVVEPVGLSRALDGLRVIASADRRISTTQSSREAEYSASRLMAITSYQGRWKAVTKSQARLSARAGVTACSAGDPVRHARHGQHRDRREQQVSDQFQVRWGT